MRQNKYEYDAFISHAVEDKIPIANELCAKLERAGLKIWYSGKELGIGDSIEKTIERGLNRSRYGIVIFSPTYLAKNWTIREFYTLLAKEIEEQKVILPVLYNITLDELKNKDLVMADRFAVNSDRGMDFVVERLVREIRKKPVIKQRVAWFSRIWLGLVLSLVANVLFLCKETVFDGAASAKPSFNTGNPAAYTRNSSTEISTKPAGLLREIRNAVTERHDCRCNHPPAEDQPILLKAGFTPAEENFGAPSRSLQPATEANSGRQGAARKMTMAVVFQIEALEPTSDEWEADMGEIFSAIHQRPESGQARFETVSSRETMASRECTHSAHVSN